MSRPIYVILPAALHTLEPDNAFSPVTPIHSTHWDQIMLSLQLHPFKAHTGTRQCFLSTVTLLTVLTHWNQTIHSYSHSQYTLGPDNAFSPVTPIHSTHWDQTMLSLHSYTINSTHWDQIMLSLHSYTHSQHTLGPDNAFSPQLHH